MTDIHQMKEALEAVYACARKPKYDSGLLITHAAYQAVRTALGVEDLVQFADGRFGCAACGAYADRETKIVAHVPECRSMSEEPKHGN